MAHFLEHLVFKGGEKYDDYRKVNETAERMGAVLNAYTSHDLVAFHITCRAEVVGEAIDLLTDFVGRPKIDAEELDRERGVVIQEIARANDQPSVVAEHLIDRAAFGDHPLGRPVLGPEEHLRTFSRDAIVAFRRRQWAGARGGAFLVGNLEHVPENQELAETFGRFPSIQAERRLRAGARVRAADAGRAARLQPVAPAHLLPAGDRPARPARARRAGRLRHAARRLDGLAPVRRDPRAARPRLLRLLGRPLVRRRADPAALRRARVRQVRRGLPRHARDRRRAAHGRADARRRSSAPAPTPPAGACWRSRTRTRSRATPRRRRSCTARRSIPDAAIAALDEVTLRPGRRRRARDLGGRVGRLRRPARGRRLRALGVNARFAVAAVARRRRCVMMRGDGEGAQPPRARALRAAGHRPVAGAAGAARRRARGRPERRAAAARARAGVRRRPRLGALRRRAVARARLPGGLAVGRLRDGRAGRRPLLHAGRVRAQARGAARRARRRRARARAAA